MAIHLVRHAKAGNRPAWGGDDASRPLTAAGVDQAHAIADLLAPSGVDRILTSHYVRCVETVTPLAEKLGLTVEDHRSLAEEASFTDAWALVEELAAAGRSAVLCSHGNILSPILDRLHRRGIPLVADELSCRKGSVWTIEVDGDGALARVVQLTAEA
jgi:phosphohistidine phosphatase SixA